MSNAMTDRKGRDTTRLTPVLVNGQRHDVPGPTISYEAVVQLAYGDSGEAKNYAVTYRGGERPQPIGTLHPGESVPVVPQMAFSVRPGKPTETQIVVSGRQYTVAGQTVSYEQVVDIWNKLHAAEGKHILGTPGIDYRDDLNGRDGVLFAGESVGIKDGTSFSVDPEHVS